MRLFITALACLISVSIFSQEETRLALVIGNANYDEGELKNPVNDAILVAQTLDSLDFDVILDTNLTDRASFIGSIRKFGIQRKNYDVGFVYYAGHGVQVDGENYLLPTKQIFAIAGEMGGEIFEEDIIEYGVNVNSILRYLTAEYGEVNVLILDACRNNPVRSMSEVTRSFTNNEDGLARNPPPSGSLIAYSTDQGKTALDGNGENSIYCESLCRNMLIEGLTIEQVFKRVRLDVERTTENRQSPVEEQKLTGDDFYLVKSDFEEEYDLIVKLSEEYKYDHALSIIEFIITKEPSVKAYNNRALIYWELEEYDKALEEYTRCIEIDPEYVSPYNRRANLYYELEEYDKALEDYARCIEIDPKFLKAYFNRANLYQNLEEYDKALKEYARCIEIDPKDLIAYNRRAFLYEELEEYDKALEEYARCIEIDPKDLIAYFNRANLYQNLEEYDKALEEYARCIEIDSDKPYIYFFQAKLYHKLQKYDKEKQTYQTAIDIDKEDPEGYYYIGLSYLHDSNYLRALRYFNLAIEKLSADDLGSLEKDYWIPNEDNERLPLSNLHIQRAEIYEKLGDRGLMCEDYEKACELGDCEAYNKHCK